MGGNPHIAKVQEQRFYEAESDPEAVAAALGLEPGEVIDFSLNVNPLGPPAAAVDAARANLDRANTYPDLRLAELRRRLAEWHGVAPDRLLFGAGLDDVIKLLIHAWTGEGDRVLVHIPTFPRYAHEVLAHGAEPVLVRSHPPWSISLEAVSAALTESRPTLAFLCTPNNPTGTTIAPEHVADLAASFLETVFVVDEALAYPLEPGAVPVAAERHNVVVLRTFSKYWGLAGLRIGYAIADPARLRAVETIRPPFNVALPSAAAALAALDDEGYLVRAREHFETEVAFFERALAGVTGCEILGRTGNMLLIGLDGLASPDLCATLARRGFLVADGRSFHGLDKVNTVRISLRDRTANAALAGTLQQAFPAAREGLP